MSGVTKNYAVLYRTATDSHLTPRQIVLLTGVALQGEQGHEVFVQIMSYLARSCCMGP